MGSLKQRIEAEIREEEDKVKELRERYDRADANDPVTQIMIMVRISHSEKRIQTLKDLLTGK